MLPRRTSRTGEENKRRARFELGVQGASFFPRLVQQRTPNITDTEFSTKQQMVGKMTWSTRLYELGSINMMIFGWLKKKSLSRFETISITDRSSCWLFSDLYKRTMTNTAPSSANWRCSQRTAGSDRRSILDWKKHSNNFHHNYYLLLIKTFNKILLMLLHTVERHLSFNSSMITGTREVHENEASYSSDPSSGWRLKLRELTISDPKKTRGDG